MFVWVAVVVLLFTLSCIPTQTSMSSVEQVELALKQGIVGFHGGSFISNLKLTDNMLKPYQSYQDYADALLKGGNHGGADVIIDEVPYIKMFLKNHTHEYTMVLYKPVTSGIGFVSVLLHLITCYFYHICQNGFESIWVILEATVVIMVLKMILVLK
ncbi:hypothetical protein R6Q57_001014 [Mikania cordata]